MSDPRFRRLDQREVDRYRGQRLERQKAALVLGSRGNRRGDQQVLDPDAEGAPSWDAGSLEMITPALNGAEVGAVEIDCGLRGR